MSEQLTDVESRMLSGEPFTYGELCAAFTSDDDRSRTIDRTIQKFRRKGLITFERKGKRIVWTATEAGKAAGQPAS